MEIKKTNREKVFTSEEIIFQALKRNEPKKLIFVKQTFKSTFGAEKTIIVSGCPVCKHGSMYQGSETKYCPNCGQKLDWTK